MCQILDKDTINKEIVPHLSVVKRVYPTKSQLAETVNAILYKLNIGVQWENQPVKSLFFGSCTEINLYSGTSVNGA